LSSHFTFDAIATCPFDRGSLRDYLSTVTKLYGQHRMLVRITKTRRKNRRESWTLVSAVWTGAYPGRSLRIRG